MNVETVSTGITEGTWRVTTWSISILVLSLTKHSSKVYDWINSSLNAASIMIQNFVSTCKASLIVTATSNTFEIFSRMAVTTETVQAVARLRHSLNFTHVTSGAFTFRRFPIFNKLNDSFVFLRPGNLPDLKFELT